MRRLGFRFHCSCCDEAINGHRYQYITGHGCEDRDTTLRLSSPVPLFMQRHHHLGATYLVYCAALSVRCLRTDCPVRSYRASRYKFPCPSGEGDTNGNPQRQLEPSS